MNRRGGLFLADLAELVGRVRGKHFKSACTSIYLLSFFFLSNATLLEGFAVLADVRFR
jgi:hypothetical protein